MVGLSMIGLSYGQYYQIPNPSAGSNPGGLNNDAEAITQTGVPAGWTEIVRGPSTAWTGAQNLPFTFMFNGSAVSTYKVHPTGVVTFSTAASLPTPGGTAAALPDASIPDQSLCYWGLSVAAGDYIGTKTFGTAPNRQFWISFFSAHSAGTQDGWVYGSIVLDETTNRVHFVDQRIQCVQGQNGCTGRPALTVGIQVNGTTAVSEASSPNYNGGTTGNDATPADNGYTTFVPGVQPANDVAMQSINIADYLILGQAPYTITGSLRNMGSAVLSGYGLSYSINGGSPVTAPITGANVATYATGTYTHPTKWNPTAEGTYTIKVWTTLPNGSADPNPADDATEYTVQVVDKFFTRKPFYEVFTSSTCPPCRPGNANFHGIVDPDKGSNVSIKWQQNFPGTGDPYVTQEALDRRALYGINSIPRMEIDGGWDGNANSFTAQMHADAKAVPSFIKITPSFKRAGKKMMVDVTVESVSDFPGNNVLHVAVVEKLTTKNVKNNGETEFEHVMKKMIPNGSGTAIGPLTKTSKITRSLEYTFKGDYRLSADGQAANMINHANEHSVEEFDDLMIITWVELSSGGTTNVFQSEEAEDECPAKNLSVTVNTEDADNCDGTAEATLNNGSGASYKWDDGNNQTTQKATGLCAGDYNVTVTDTSGCEATTKITVKKKQGGGGGGGGGVSVAEVFANSSVSIYPNPANDQFNVNIENLATEATIEVIDVIGKVVLSAQQTETTATIDVSSLTKGVYTVKISAGENSTSKKLIIE